MERAAGDRLRAAAGPRPPRARRTSSGSKGIGSIRQIGCSASSQPRRRADRGGGERPRAASRRARPACGWRRSTPELGTAGDRGVIPGSSSRLPVVPTPPCSRAIRSTASADLGGGERRRRGAAPSASSRRAKPGRRSRAAGARRRRSRRPPSSATPSRLEHRALLDVELEVGADRAESGVGVGGAVELDAVRGEHLADAARPRRRSDRRRAAGSRRARRAPSCRTGCARSATPSSSAKSIRTRSRAAAARPAAQARRTPSAGDHAEGAVERAAGRAPSRGASRARAPARRGPSPAVAPRGCPPRRSRSRDADRGEAPGAGSGGPAPLRRPADAAGAVGAAGQPRRARARSASTRVGVDRRRRASPRVRSSHALPAQRLREAVGAAAAEREHAQVGVVDLDPAGAELLVEALRVPRSRAPGRRRARSR